MHGRHWVLDGLVGPTVSELKLLGTFGTLTASIRLSISWFDPSTLQKGKVKFREA